MKTRPVTSNLRTASVFWSVPGCGEAVKAVDIKLTSLKQDGCDLNWELETDNDKVVFIISQTSAMRERLTQIITVLAVSASGLEKIEAQCEVSD